MGVSAPLAQQERREVEKGTWRLLKDLPSHFFEWTLRPPISPLFFFFFFANLLEYAPMDLFGFPFSFLNLLLDLGQFTKQPLCL